MFFDAFADAYYINIRMDAALTAKKQNRVQVTGAYLAGLHLHILKGKNS